MERALGSETRLPDPALVVLVGASGSGKSTWAARHFASNEVVSSDALRAVVGSGPGDLDASADAFALLDQIVAARLTRGLTTVIDTLGLAAEARREYLRRGREAGLPCVAVQFDTPAAVCRARNAQRDRPVPARALTAQFAKSASVADELATEGWDAVIAIRDGGGRDGGGAIEPAASAPSSRAARPLLRKDGGMALVLNVSRFPWGEEPGDWLWAIAVAANAAGFAGIALMDHLIQIPQVGRAWDPIPEAFVTLGLLAGLDTDLHLGTLVSPLSIRRPGVLAKAVATLDVLTGGRAFCGVGAGWWEREHLAYGLEFGSTRARLDGVESGIETMRALWAPGTKPYAGTRVSLPETTCYPRPVHDIPMIVGGSGERRTLEIAARLGDAINVPSDLAVLERKRAVLREHCVAAGRDPDEVAVTVLDLPIVGATRDEVAALVEKHRGRTPASAVAKQHHAGTVEDHIRRYRLLADLGVTASFVAPVGLTGPADVLALAPLAAALA